MSKQPPRGGNILIFDSRVTELEAECNALQTQLAEREDWRETEDCGYCDGTGYQSSRCSSPPCAYCNGTGRVVAPEPPAECAGSAAQEAPETAGDAPST